MKKVKAVIQARMGSTRLKNKSLLLLANRPIIFHCIERLQAVKSLEQIILATSELPENDSLADYAVSLGIKVIRGSDDNVLSRFILAEKLYPTDFSLRITADNPLLAFDYADAFIDFTVANDLDYSGITGLPLGMGFEFYRASCLLNFENLKLSAQHYEHVTPYFYENPNIYKIANFIVKLPILEQLRFLPRLTVDTEIDYKLMSKIYDTLYKNKPITTAEILEFCLKNKEICQINLDIEQRKYNVIY